MINEYIYFILILKSISYVFFIIILGFESSQAIDSTPVRGSTSIAGMSIGNECILYLFSCDVHFCVWNIFVICLWTLIFSINILDLDRAEVFDSTPIRDSTSTLGSISGKINYHSTIVNQFVSIFVLLPILRFTILFLMYSIKKEKV